MLGGLWSEIADLRRARLAHRNLALTNVLISDDESAWILDFDSAEVAASDRDLDRDVAELLVGLSVKVGVAATVDSAVEVLGAEAVARTLPQLQPLALPTEIRSLARRHKDLLKDLSTAIRDSTGAGEVELERLQRIKPRTILMIVAGSLLWLIAPIRRRVVGPVVGILKSAGGHLGAGFTSPIRVLALFGGSAMITFAYAATLGFSVQAFGGGLSVPEICTAFIVAVTIATIAPTPGGLGALEATMIAALAGFGMDHGPAVGAVLTFRLATFWLPILPGWYTFAWMQRNGEL